MHIAHRLFHQDSRHLLSHLASTDGSDHRAELGILLATALMRGARQDWYEQGDIWAVLATNRPRAPTAPLDRVSRLETSIRRLLTADLLRTSVDRSSHTQGSIAHLVCWAAVFHTAGEHLANLAQDGALQRGLRAVLAHHVIFSWNRLGLPLPTQSLLSHAARAVILADS